MDRSKQFSLASLFAVISTIAIILGILCGIWRLTQYVIVKVERDYWTQRIRDGRLENPHNSPASTFLTPNEIDELVQERQVGESNP